MTPITYTVESIEVPSTDGIHTLRGVVYIPSCNIPKGVLQITHGMAEHIDRYADFMASAACAGFVVCGHDHLGHGKTAENEDELGFFAEKDGWRILTKDIHAFGEAVSENYIGIPHFLLGHSMGSFLARAAVALYPGAFDALVIMGTGGPNALSTTGLMLTAAIRRSKGDKHISKLTHTLTFGSYNKRTGSRDPFAWLTCDEELRQKHNQDPLCLFPFTVSAMNDLIAVQKAVNQKSWFASVKKDLPILIVSGEEDPVGNYGKGVKAIYDGLIDAGCTNVSLKLYPYMRHEILNEVERETVYLDIENFLLSLTND